MTHQLDVARGHEVVARWCILAEQRLEHLTELFETGRWRRYHSEHSFLENFREAKAAVQIWRGLAGSEASLDNFPVDMSWLGRGRTALPPRQPISNVHVEPQPVQISTEPPPSDFSVMADKDHGPADNASLAPNMESPPELTRDVEAIEQRYPSLRNAL